MKLYVIYISSPRLLVSVSTIFLVSVSASLVETVPALSRSQILKTGVADVCYITKMYMTSIFMAAVSALYKEEFIKLQQSRQE